MTSKHLAEWRLYDQLEPFGEERADFRSAQIAQALWNIARDPKVNPKGWPLEDFLLTFGDRPTAAKAQQSSNYQEMLIDAWVAGSNAVFAKGTITCQ